MRKITNIAILGGGLTGLTLANLLKNDVKILEKENECGGLCRSILENGYTFDWGGSHVIFSKDNEVLEFTKNILENNIVQRRRNAKILYNGRLVKYPFENGLADLSREDNLECLRGFLDAYKKRNNGGEIGPNNFKEWMYYMFGSGIAEKYLVPYNKKIWKLDPTNIDICWVKDRVPQPPVEHIVSASCGSETEGYIHQLNFYYPQKGGIQALINSLEKKIQDKIIFDFNINKIEKIEDGWSISNGEEYIKCKEIISTIPLFDLIYSLKNVPKNVLGALNDLKYNSLITVMIGFKTRNTNNISWLYIPDPSCLSHRVSFPSNYTDTVVPFGKSSVLAEITYNNECDIIQQSDEDIVNNIINYLDQNKLINKNDVEYTKIKRVKYGYVINNLNYRKNIKIIREYLKIIGIHTVGRFSEWEYYNMDACIRSAMNLISGWKYSNKCDEEYGS